MGKLKDKIESMLLNGYGSKSPQQLRDSDKWLLLAVWHSEGLTLDAEQTKTFLNKCTTSESITRARRLLKTDYPASDQVNERRYERFKSYRQTGGHYE